MRLYKRDHSTFSTGSRSLRLIGGVSLALVLSGYSLMDANAQPAQNDAPASVDWSKAEPVEIVMTNYSFTPKALQLRRNTPYRLHFVNNGSKDHSFDAPELFRAMVTAPDDRAKVARHVQAGAAP